MIHLFDGHANCFIEIRPRQGPADRLQLRQRTLPGNSLPGIGPFSLLKETEMNHWGKVMFRWIYWNILLPGKELPVPALMSMAGKMREDV